MTNLVSKNSGAIQLSDNEPEAICTVTELTKKLNLSRARFYQLQKIGVFPKPIYCIYTRRPLYTPKLQQKCLEIRRTGIGHNGRLISFNSPRQNKAKGYQNQSDEGFEELVELLKRMGIRVSSNKVKNAIEALYPEGMGQSPAEGTIIRELFRYFKQGV